MTRPRAADDFSTIRARMKELRREAARPANPEGAPRRAQTPSGEGERRLKERREGCPPPWVPTIFVRKPEDIEVARRLWRIRAGLRTR